MSFIINNTSPFISVKLTELGRMSLSQGKLNFAFWGIGDSEINYNREEIVDNNQSDVTLSGASKILRPFDRQPNIKSFITTGGTEPLITMSASDIKVIKAIVNNKADERGFFYDNLGVFTTLTGSTYIQSTEIISNTTLTGGTTLLISSATTKNNGDFILIKLSNDTVTGQTNNSNTTPIPHLWFKIQSSTSNSITVDRELPNYSNQTFSTSQIIIYRGGEVYNSIATGDTTSYWDTGTLQFDSCCDVSCRDVPVWNMNQVWCEDIAGITGTTYENYTKFGSFQYLGIKYPYLEYICSGDTTSISCAIPNQSIVDPINKSISILHYTNNTISNFYGEFFFIDNSNNKTLKLFLPDLMYHRRAYSSGSGTTMGMTFLASGSTNKVGDSEIEYIDLIEDSTLISNTPLVVGRVFPQLKIVVIDDDEIIAAMSYKSNRNWTLPELSATFTSPSGGTSTGVLEVNKTMYLTYTLENKTGTGLTTSLPCQKYIKITNTTSSAKDVAFKLNNVDLLPYMRKIEDPGYDGLGFNAHTFKLMYQIVDNIDNRPASDLWKTYDFTSTAITTNSGETINPVKLENQIPLANGFILTKLIDSGATIFDLIQTLSMPLNSSPDSLQFGDERFFYGNLDTYIGATIFKTLFDIRINSGQFTTTSNPSRSKDLTTNPPKIRVSEIGIYDSNRNLVISGKLSKPVKLLGGNTVLIEASLDF